MSIAFKRSIRQAISLAVALVSAYFTYTYTKSAEIFDLQNPPGISTWGPWAAAIAAIFIVYYVVMIIVSGKAAR